MLNASADIRFFLGIYYDQNDSNIYIEYHDILVKNNKPPRGGYTEDTQIHVI